MSARSLLVALLGLALPWLEPPSAAAKCRSPAPELLWSYPADGDVDVPTNALLWTLNRRWGAQPSASLNGIPLPDARSTEGIAERSLGELEPNHDYVLRLDYTVDSGTDASVPTSHEISFRTGAGPAERLGAPQVVDAQLTAAPSGGPRSAALADAECVDEIHAQDCFDTGQSVLVRLDASEPRAVGWLIDEELWPARCGMPSRFVRSGIGGGEACFELRALGPGGLPGAPVRHCTELPDQGSRKGALPDDEALSEGASDESTASCSMGTTTLTGSATWLLGLAAVLWRRRRQHARKPPTHR